MPRVVALYRHPIKGFTPESVDELTVQTDGRIRGDRVLTFRFADALQPENRHGLDYWPKSKGLALEAFPSLATLRVQFDHDAQRVRLTDGMTVLADAALDTQGREALSRAVTAFVGDSSEARLLQRPGRLPIRLIGDPERSRFQDHAAGYVSVHSAASVAALNEALPHPVDDRRFRSNIVIDAVPAWDELSWTGQVRIGDVVFDTAGPIVRCLATHANPDTGIRDAKVLTTLTRALGQQQPTLGRLLQLPGVSGAVGDISGTGGVIRVGDEVTV